jgi:hypothetical protein
MNIHDFQPPRVPTEGRKWNFRNGFPTRALRRGLAFDTLSLRPVPADLGRGATQAVPSGAVSGRLGESCRNTWRYDEI